MAHGSLLLLLLLLLVDQIDLHLLLLHLHEGLLLGCSRHCFSTLRAHPAVVTSHVVLNLFRLETVVLLLHVDSSARLVGVLAVRLTGRVWVDSLRSELLLIGGLSILVIGVEFLAPNLIVLQLIIFRLGFIILHVDHFVAAVIFVLVLIVSWHDVLEIWVLVLIHLTLKLAFSVLGISGGRRVAVWLDLLILS